jgi:hypothetical protein
MKNANHSEKVSNIRTRALDSATSESSVASDAKDSRVELLPQGVADVTSIAKSSTGPRTDLGKERSKRNAIKHGVFSKVAVLKDEPKEEFDFLRKGLYEDYQPEGAIEEVLVEKLATILWRQRRVLMAEGAEIRKGTEFLKWNQERKVQEEIKKKTSSDIFFSGPSLMDRIENPLLLEHCLDLLTQLQKNIKENGFCPEEDGEILKELCGDSSGTLLEESLRLFYDTWRIAAEISEKKRAAEGYATPRECVNYVLERISDEIHRLKMFQLDYAKIEESRIEIETLRQQIPDDPRAERLMRYEASLERAFDRTLNQLERIQRMRKGQVVPPPLNVQVNS